MASPFAPLKRFAGTRKGKLVLGGTAVGGAVTAGLVARKRAGGDPATEGGEEITAPPFGVAPGSPAGGGFDDIANPTIDMGQFEQLLADLARSADALDDIAAKPGATPPATTPPRTYKVQQGTPPTYTVRAGDTWTAIAKEFYGTNVGVVTELLQRNRSAAASGATKGAALRTGGKIYLPPTVGGKARVK